MAVTAERRSYLCQSAGGAVSEKIEVKSKCMLIHRVTRPASNPLAHAWKPVVVGVLFFTSPESPGCGPTNRGPRTVRYEASLMPGETREFGVDTLGFVDEACADTTSSVVYFPPAWVVGTGTGFPTK
jgi:hypothetical protein